MANPFTSITCTVRYDNARVVTWTMLPGANYPGDMQLQIENSRSGGEWHVLATGLAGTCSFVDSRRRNYNKRMNECYRLRMTSESTGDNWISDVVDAGNYKAYPFSSEAENVIKQIETAMETSGTSGVLLKRKLWGVRCPSCVDFSGQESVNEHCPRCLGTGIDGGYFPGISLDIIKDAIQTSEQPSQLGYAQTETVQGRCIAYPWICYGDVWCEDGTNKRYEIAQVTPTASYKQTSLVYTVTMHLLELSDIMYSSKANDMVLNRDVYTDPSIPPVMPNHTQPGRANAWDDLLQ